MWAQITTHISRATGQPFEVTQSHSVSGGCINQGYHLIGGDRAFFVKVNQADRVAMFEAEAEGLREMDGTRTIRVPRPICWGKTENSGYLVLEWLDLGRGNRNAWESMGRQLADLHRNISQKGFGWQHQNTIGSTAQINPWTQAWIDFWVEHRLGYQFHLAQRRGGHFPKQKQLMAAIPQLLSHHNPQPSLVHGDLWSGNVAVVRSGEPIIFDPATYYGDREVDLAMTELFGGFPAEFYRAYQQVFPLPDGYKQRKTLYNLYHILNHFNLFGGGYESQANSMIETALRNGC